VPLWLKPFGFPGGKSCAVAAAQRLAFAPEDIRRQHFSTKEFFIDTLSPVL